MPNTRWKDIAELIGIAAIVASLLFVGLQMQQDRNLTQAQILSDQDDTQIEWARLLQENFELWVSGMDGEELGKLELARFEVLAGAYFSKRSYLYQRILRLPTINPDAAAAVTANVIETYPGLKSAWGKRWSMLQKHGLEPPFEMAVQKSLDDIRQGRREHIQHNSYWLH